jgi:VWFA-related protein
MNVVQNLTRDPASALATLDDKNFSKMALGSQVSNWRSEMRRFMDEMSEVRVQVDSRDRLEHEMGVARMNGLPSEAESLAGMDRSYTITLLTQLRALVSQMAQSTEHRTLLLCSDGFQMSPGREVWALLVAYFPELNRYALRTMDRLSVEFDAIVKVATKSNIVIDTIDSRGLYTSSYFDASNPMASARVGPRVISVMSNLQTEAGDSLMEFAAATGGTAYMNSNDIFSGIQQAVAEGRDYYTLAYVPANTAMDGKYRKLAVEVKGRKLTVKAKRGYWATEN